MTHVRTIRIRGYHCDFYGHLNHARYLELLEEARWSYLEGRMDLADWAKRNRGIVVASLTINYRRPAPVDIVLDIHSTMKEINTRTGVIHQEMINQATGKVLADADVTFAVIDTTTGRAVPLEGDLREVFARGAVLLHVLPCGHRKLCRRIQDTGWPVQALDACTDVDGRSVTRRRFFLQRRICEYTDNCISLARGAR